MARLRKLLASRSLCRREPPFPPIGAHVSGECNLDPLWAPAGRVLKLLLSHTSMRCGEAKVPGAHAFRQGRRLRTATIQEHCTLSGAFPARLVPQVPYARLPPDPPSRAAFLRRPESRGTALKGPGR